MDAWESLKKQTYQDWEWVIVPDRPSAGTAIPDVIKEDPRVAIVHAPAELQGNIGALKLVATAQCRGDLFVELDHDDMLFPDALEKLLMAAQETKAGFLFSDFVEFWDDNSSSHVYSNVSGWETYKTTFRDAEYEAMRAFDVTPSSLCRIEFAPNHLRAWTREAYEKAGGHNPDMPVGDDHELICRTYLAGVKFHHVKQALYMYRLRPFGGNYSRENNAEVQKAAQQNTLRYSHDLVVEWCKREGHGMLDLGGVANSPEGFTSVDLREGADIQDDVIRYLIARVAGKHTYGCIRAQDFLEHIPIGDVVPLMNLICEALVPGGWFISSTPSTDGRGAFMDPTHVSFWNQLSFGYYTDRQYAQYVDGINCRFQGITVRTAFPTEWHRQNNVSYVFADLAALKGQRQPGECKI